MSRDFIRVNTASPQGRALIDYARQLRAAYDQGRRILAIMTHNNDTTNFADIESLYGLEAGNGQVVFDLVNGSVGSLEGNFQVDDAKEITERIA